MNDSELKIDLGPLHAIPPGQGRNFEFAGERIAVFHTRAGEVFAVQAACPHKNGPLADGLVGGNAVICPLHAWKFDLATGECTLDRIRDEGPLSASDFERSRTGWWEWSESKRMLEWLFWAGHITTSTRRGSFVAVARAAPGTGRRRQDRAAAGQDVMN